MKKLLLILLIGIVCSCSSAPPAEGNDEVGFATYKVPKEIGFDYWYVAEKNGLFFYIISEDDPLTSPSEITEWDHESFEPREVNSPGSQYLSYKWMPIEDLPLELQWELGY